MTLGAIWVVFLIVSNCRCRGVINDLKDFLISSQLNPKANDIIGLLNKILNSLGQSCLFGNNNDENMIPYNDESVVRMTDTLEFV